MSDFDRALANARARRGLAPHGSSAQPDTRALIIGGGAPRLFTALQQTEETQARTGGDQKTSWVNVATVQGLVYQVTCTNNDTGTPTMEAEFWKEKEEIYPIQRTRPARPLSIFKPMFPDMQWRKQLFIRFVKGALQRYTYDGPRASTTRGITDYTLELLDFDGATLKTCTQRFDEYEKIVAVEPDSSKIQSMHIYEDAQIFDANPPCNDFYGIRLKCVTDGPTDGGMGFDPQPNVQITLLDGDMNG